MQILGLSDSTPKPENRLKALFWPSIRNETDVDHVTRQGFWICAVLAASQIAVGALQGRVMLIAECVEGAFFFLSGVGVRMRSVFAAACAFFVYSAGTLLLGIGTVRIIFIALLLANLRAVWLSARWRGTHPEPPPIPMNETVLDKLSDRMPIALWPVGRYFYYLFAVVEVIALALGILLQFRSVIRMPLPF